MNQNEAQDQQDNDRQQHDDRSIKKVALAAFGAVSHAVEKAADALGDAVSPANIDKYAKKGEKSIADLKETSDALVKKVRDIGAQTLRQVKGPGQNSNIQYKDMKSAEQAIRDELNKLIMTAEQAQSELETAGDNEDKLERYKIELVSRLNQHKAVIADLLNQLSAFQKKDISETAHFSEPVDGEVPYETQSYPRSVYDRKEHTPADYEKASPLAPDKDNNTIVLETDSLNDHLDQNWPIEMG